MLTMASCASQGAREADVAAQEALRVTAEQVAAARLAQEQERARAAELQAQRQQQTAERVRRETAQAEAAAQAAQAQARADEAQQQRAEAERRERERLAAIAAAAAQRQEKLDRITALEQQIAATLSQASDDEASSAILRQAILVAEELLDMLTAEQAKYEATDADGNTVQALAKQLIAEIEARKDSLLSRVDSQ